MRDRKVTQRITLIVAGGFVSVTYIHNRDTTRNIDYFALEQNGQDNNYRLLDAIKEVAEMKGWSREWMSWYMAIAAPGEEERTRWVEESIAQGTILYQSQMLIIYAAKWEWAISSKLKRLGSINPALPGAAEKRANDILDLLAMLKLLIDTREKTLTRNEIVGWYPKDGYIFPATLDT